MKTLYELKTGKPLTVEAVDAKEILKHSPELYSETPPKPKEEHEDEGSDDGAKMKVADIRAALDAKGIDYTGVTKKADLQALLDAAA